MNKLSILQIENCKRNWHAPRFRGKCSNLILTVSLAFILQWNSGKSIDSCAHSTVYRIRPKLSSLCVSFGMPVAYAGMPRPHSSQYAVHIILVDTFYWVRTIFTYVTKRNEKNYFRRNAWRRRRELSFQFLNFGQTISTVLCSSRWIRMHSLAQLSVSLSLPRFPLSSHMFPFIHWDLCAWSPSPINIIPFHLVFCSCNSRCISL